MAARIARLAEASPRRLLLLSVLLVVAMGAYAVGVPERLALGGTAVDGAESEAAADDLGAALGYAPEPAYIVVLAASEPVAAGATRVAVETLETQIFLMPGVAHVEAGPRSEDGRTTTIAVHAEPDLDPGRLDDLGDGLTGSLDPGPFDLLIGGPAATADAARAAAGDDAPAMALLALPLLALVLIGSLGLRIAAATLIGAALAVAATVATLGLLGELFTLRAAAVVPSALIAAVLAVETTAGLLYRYREEAGSLGIGSEALGYSLHLALKAGAIGAISAALVGAALLIVPIGLARSIGAGAIVAALLAPPMALLPAAAALRASPPAAAATPLPLLADGANTSRAPLPFRAFFALGRVRSRAIVALLPVAAIAALALPLGDSEAIGLSSTELPDDANAREAGAQLAGAFGPGFAGPLLVVTDGPPEAPTITIYRDEIFSAPEIADVGLPFAAGDLTVFEAVPAARPQSLAGQRAAAEVRGTPALGPRRVAGPGAVISDAGERLGRDLPLVALIAILGTAALWSLLFRSAFGPLLAVSAAAAPVAGLSAMLILFGDGRLASALDYAPAGAPHVGSFLIVGAVLLAISLSRGAQLATALREERSLGGGLAGSLARSSLLTLMPAAVATLSGIALAGVWLGSDLLVAKEIAVGVSVGLAIDLVLVRLLLAPALARLAM